MKKIIERDIWAKKECKKYFFFFFFWGGSGQDSLQESLQSRPGLENRGETSWRNVPRAGPQNPLVADAPGGPNTDEAFRAAPPRPSASLGVVSAS